MYLRKKRRQKQKPIESTNPKYADLVLDIGEFAVTQSGVQAKIRPPLDILSRHYSWQSLPFGLSAVRALVTGDSDDWIIDRLVNMIGLNSYSLDILESRISRSSIVSDTSHLLNWSFRIADYCPDESVATVLRSMRKMDKRSMDSYVASLLD